MRKKIATVFVVSFCLILILFSFFGKSVTLGIRLIIALAAFVILIAFYYSIRKMDKNGEIKSTKKAESQKIINDNIDLLHKRWKRIEKEYNSGTLKTVSKWYFEDATYDQISLLKEMGINPNTLKLTKGQASDIIGLFEPSEKKNTAILENQRTPPFRMNKTEAREFIIKSRDDLVESQYGIIHLTEHLIIKQLEDDFIYFVRFFDSRVRNNGANAEFVSKNDRYRVRFEQAAQLGLACQGVEISLEERLKSLKLSQLNSIAETKKFSRKPEAIENLMQIPDIADRFESLAPIDDCFQLKNMKLDMEYLESKWLTLHGDEY